MNYVKELQWIRNEKQNYFDWSLGYLSFQSRLQKISLKYFISYLQTNARWQVYKKVKPGEMWNGIHQEHLTCVHEKVSGFLIFENNPQSN